MRKRLFTGLFLIGVVVANTVSPANATLVTIGTATYAGSDYQLIYEVEDQITWLDYRFTGNAATNPGSLSWAAGLSAELTINLYAGYSASWGGTEWRLPEASGYFTNNSFNDVYGSEMEDLYYTELGNELNDTSLNFGDFENLVAAYQWLEPNFPISPSYAPFFYFVNGTDGITTSSVNGSGISAMAVRSGEVVLEPMTIALLSLGSLLLRKRKA